MISPLPVPPSKADPVNFSTRADAFLGALPTFQAEANALQTDVNAKQTQAATSATNAAASEAAAAATADASIWISGTTYAIGDNRFSPTNFLTYRRKTNGAGTTDPISDSTNWTLVASQGDVTLAGTQTFTGSKTFSSPIIGTLTGNASTVTNGVYTTGAQTIAGVKTFSSTIAGSINGNAGTVTNGVYTTGDQTIAGVKTFSSTIAGNVSGTSANITGVLAMANGGTGAANAYVNSLSMPSGYQKFPNGLIMAWAKKSDGSQTGTMTLPITFPNAGLFAVCSYDQASTPSSNAVPGAAITSASQVTYYNAVAANLVVVAFGY